MAALSELDIEELELVLQFEIELSGRPGEGSREPGYTEQRQGSS